MRSALPLTLATYVAWCAVAFHVDFAHRDLWFFGVAVIVYATSIGLLRRTLLTPRRLVLLIVGVGALLQLIALTRAPLTSDDSSRYAWDATVQLHGVDPYRYVPSAPELAHLRSPQLFGPSSACTHPIPGSCTAINRPDVHTIYPPVAQAAFVIGHLLGGPAHAGLFGFQILAAFGCVAVAALLARRALRRHRPVWPVALWAWSPVVVSEYGNNAHIDWLGVLLTVLALEAGRRGKDGRAGALIGAAIATKLYPALVLPALMKRRPLVTAAAAVGLVVLVYLPHVIAVGSAVVGYLPGYLHEEGYNSGSRLLLVGSVLPHPVDTAAGAIILALVAWRTWRRTDPAAPEHAATLLTGTAFLVATPAYGWYAGLLVALAVMSARYEWVALALAPTLVYLVRAEVTHSNAVSALIYFVAACATAAIWRFRSIRRRPTKPEATTPGEPGSARLRLVRFADCSGICTDSTGTGEVLRST